MKISTKIHGIAIALALGLAGNLKAQDLYIVTLGSNLGEYGLDGSLVNGLLLDYLAQPWGLVVSGNDIFVASQEKGNIGEYTTSGATINATLITGLGNPTDIAISPAPEPSTIALAGMGAAALWLRRRFPRPAS